jgi:hypothetical protein
MVAERLSGPVSLLQGRLAAQGFQISEATLRAGDCRLQLERVWKRRPRSRQTYGPTRGHDLKPVIQLVDEVIDLKARIGRVEADLEGAPFNRSKTVQHDPRSRAVCAMHAEAVAEKAAEIPIVVRFLARRGIFPDYKTVAQEMTTRGHTLHHRSIRRNERYWRPILKFHDIAPPIKPIDPERDRLLRKSSEELGAMVVRLLDHLREVEARFEAKLN